MNPTVPTVHLIARPSIDAWGLRRFLTDVVSDAEHHVQKYLGMQPGSALIEFAGRLCYKSWEPGLNPNVTKVRRDSAEYLRNILAQQHGSVLEHANYTFVFKNVSRVFTHELVRHRAGVAISQESLRYVRLSDLKVWLPSAFTDEAIEELGIVSLVESLEEFQVKAARYFELDAEGVPFKFKKEITSALRRLAPTGLATNLVWSANLRTIRHVIEMRTAVGAEEEIRRVFQDVYSVMIVEEPWLFQDYSVNDDGEVVTEYRKV